MIKNETNAGYKKSCYWSSFPTFFQSGSKTYRKISGQVSIYRKEMKPVEFRRNRFPLGWIWTRKQTLNRSLARDVLRKTTFSMSARFPTLSCQQFQIVACSMETWTPWMDFTRHVKLMTLPLWNLNTNRVKIPFAMK